LAAISQLEKLHKPLIIVLNKSDWYQAEELESLTRAVKQKLSTAEVDVVAVRSGGEEVVIHQLPDGSEERVTHQRDPDVSALIEKLQYVIDTHRNIMDSLRDSAVFVLAQNKLDTIIGEERNRRAQQIVKDYARKAVVGGLAAISPGSDLLIQGVIGTRMLRELSDVYEVPIRQADTDVLIELVQKHVGTTRTLLLAIAGNGLKAFPGIGTVTGGLLHAIAYGMIFNTLGKAVIVSLQTRGELRPLVASQLFKEQIGDNLEASARRYAKLAVEHLRGKD
jgi:GTPase involved in cell partitioning and DNA repair